MFLLKKKSSIILSLLLSLGLLQAQKAGASNFQVTPIKVSFSARVSSQVLTIRNVSKEALRFQLHTYTWNQDAKGEMQLDATEEIIAFPGLFSLDPGEVRSVRVGTLTPVGASEKTYRIFIEQLPSSAKPTQNTSGIRILTRIGIPIFLQPIQQVLNGRLENIAVNKSRLSFQLKNTGNVHFIAQKIRVKGLGEAGNSVFDRQRNGWYVLAGASQPYDLEIPQKECKKVRSLEIEVKTEKKVFTEKLQIPKGACTASK
jgi:fimbrial chaperone protein